VMVGAVWKHLALGAVVAFASACGPARIVADETTVTVPAMTVPASARQDEWTSNDVAGWSARLQVTRPMGAAWLVAYYSQQLERHGWRPGVVLMHDELTTQRLTWRDARGQPWVGVLVVTALSRGTAYDIVFRVVRLE